MKQRSSRREQQAICGVSLISVNGSQMLAAYRCLLRLRYGQFQTATVSLLDTPAGGFWVMMSAHEPSWLECSAQAVGQGKPSLVYRKLSLLELLGGRARASALALVIINIRFFLSYPEGINFLFPKVVY